MEGVTKYQSNRRTATFEALVEEKCLLEEIKYLNNMKM